MSIPKYSTSKCTKMGKTTKKEQVVKKEQLNKKSIETYIKKEERKKPL